MATEANETTPRTGPPAAVGSGANGTLYPVYAPGTEDWYCTEHQAYHPNGNRCLLEPASLKDTPPATSVRWEQDNDHPGFAPPANDSATETSPPPRSPAAGAKSSALTAAQLVRLAEAQRYLERTIDMMP